jgi:pimeloyl-ACP methyl ester carboxylesterase
MVQDLVGLLNALEIRNAVFVGHSWGADIVLHLAELHPDYVSEVVVVEGALLAPLAPIYRSPEWEGWPYASATIESLLGRPIPVNIDATWITCSGH